MQQTMKFSPIMNFKNGAIKGCFVENNNKPIILKLENLVAPLGLSKFGDKSSMILNINEDVHNIEDLLLVQAACKEHPECEGKEFNHLVKCTEKYGRQIKVNFTPATMFFNEDSKPCSSSIFSNKCRVNILIEVNMMWIRGNSYGVSLKCLQVKHLKDVSSFEENNELLPRDCVI
tara:strand:+ start:3608 stop:4132 length:525 start_codon:yes stop_codon:yes gene_type:complete